jgi:hypothetical protein
MRTLWILALSAVPFALAVASYFLPASFLEGLRDGILGPNVFWLEMLRRIGSA